MNDMLHTPDDQHAEQLLTQHLSHQLEPQRGRAAAAFLAAVRAGDAPQVSPAISIEDHDRHARQVRRTMWLWGGIPSGLAACVALAVGAQLFLSRPTPIGGGANPNQVQVTPASIEDTTWTRNVDGGMITGDAGPLRVQRQQTVHQRVWIGPDGAVYRLTEPAEKVGYEAERPF